MPSPIAACKRCSSTDVIFAGDHVSGETRYHFHCYGCGHDTPDRGQIIEADLDVIWLNPSHPARLHITQEAT